MKKNIVYFLVGIACVFIFVNRAGAHCEIPCGIYDDKMRVHMILEHISTIEKSMNQILSIEKEKAPNYNQLIRWVVNKENHANEIQEMVTQYFMTQRIKPDTKDYGKKLVLLHQMLIYSMKCKQTTELSHIQKLRGLIKEFQKIYFSRE